MHYSSFIKVLSSVFCIVVVCLSRVDSSSLRFAYQNVLLMAPTISSVVPVLVDKISNSSIIVKRNGTLQDLDDHVSNSKPKDNEDKALRPILCNEKENHSPISSLRYDLTAGKCAEIGKQEHCGTNMIFKEELDSGAYGYCECDFEKNTRPLVFHRESNSCSYIYQQAYCAEGEWLVLSKALRKAICEPNRCRDSMVKRKLMQPIEPERGLSGLNKSENDIIVSRKSKPKQQEDAIFVPINGNGTCVELNASSDLCEENDEVVLFPPNEIDPRCGIPVNDENSYYRSMSILPNPCNPGSYYSIIGRCQPDWDF